MPSWLPNPPRHTRDDYSSREDYLRYLREAGLPLAEPAERRAPRVSAGLRQLEFMKLYRAVALANLRGEVLDTFTTISFQTLGYESDEAVEAGRRKFMELYRHWCVAQEIACAALWVKERSSRSGLHVHVLGYVPPQFQLKYRSWAKRALERLSGQTLVRPKWNQPGPKLATLHISARNQGRPPIGNQWEIFHYMTKGADERALGKIITRAHSDFLTKEFRQARIRPQGIVRGKRSGVTRSLDDASQEAYDQEFRLPGHLWPGAERQVKQALHFDDAFLAYGVVQRSRLRAAWGIGSLDG